MRTVEVSPLDVGRMAALIGDDRALAIAADAARLRGVFEGRTLWNVNATATGGGVAEMLQVLLSYARGVGIDAQWLVLDGEPTFFATTKRLHNLIHGMPGEGGPLSEAERANYDEVLARNLGSDGAFKAGDVMLLHDPQTAGMIPALKAQGYPVIWRSHIGRDVPNEYTQKAWQFLAPYLEQADVVIVSRPSYAPPSVTADKVVVIAPSIDPFATKNCDLNPGAVRRILIRCGVAIGEDDGRAIWFPRRDGQAQDLAHELQASIVGDKLPLDVPFLLQVSRWDRLKDMSGVMQAFIDHPDIPQNAHLVLCGPDVSGVTDDPEGAEVLMECSQMWGTLDEAMQQRIHLVCLPMSDTDANALMVNALQRQANVVAQKSLFEGFGLTVTEAMWKSRPMVASAIGGIQDQIEDGRDGILIADAHDLAAFGAAVAKLLTDEPLADQMGKAAREKVLKQFLGDRHLRQYADLLRRLV